MRVRCGTFSSTHSGLWILFQFTEELPNHNVKIDFENPDLATYHTGNAAPSEMACCN
jgi:hypothetical protein